MMELAAHDHYGYSKEELDAMVNRMRLVVHRLYPELVQTNCHPFIEFCGLMSKYVDVCERAARSGVQFPFASVHGETPLPVENHDLMYLAEKLGCIFAPMIQANPDAREAFARELLGVNLETQGAHPALREPRP